MEVRKYDTYVCMFVGAAIRTYAYFLTKGLLPIYHVIYVHVFLQNPPITYTSEGMLDARACCMGRLNQLLQRNIVCLVFGRWWCGGRIGVEIFLYTTNVRKERRRNVPSESKANCACLNDES